MMCSCSPSTSSWSSSTLICSDSTVTSSLSWSYDPPDDRRRRFKSPSRRSFSISSISVLLSSSLKLSCSSLRVLCCVSNEPRRVLCLLRRLEYSVWENDSEWVHHYVHDGTCHLGIQSTSTDTVCAHVHLDIRRIFSTRKFMHTCILLGYTMYMY